MVVSTVAAPFYFPSAVHKEPSFSVSLSALANFCVFDTSRPSGYEVTLIIAWISVSLRVSNVEHLSVCTYCPFHILILEKCLFTSFVHS